MSGVVAPVVVTFSAQGVETIQSQIQALTARMDGMAQRTTQATGQMSGGFTRLSVSGAFAIQSLFDGGESGVLRFLRASSQLAFAFNPLAGAAVTAGALVARSLIDNFHKAEEEAKKSTDAMAKTIADLGRSGDQAKVAEMMGTLERGDIFAGIEGKRSGESDDAFKARSVGIEGLREQIAQLEAALHSLHGVAADESRDDYVAIENYKAMPGALQMVQSKIIAISPAYSQHVKDTVAALDAIKALRAQLEGLTESYAKLQRVQALIPAKPDAPPKPEKAESAMQEVDAAWQLRKAAAIKGGEDLLSVENQFWSEQLAITSTSAADYTQILTRSNDAQLAFTRQASEQSERAAREAAETAKQARAADLRDWEDDEKRQLALIGSGDTQKLAIQQEYAAKVASLSPKQAAAQGPGLKLQAEGQELAVEQAVIQHKLAMNLQYLDVLSSSDAVYTDVYEKALDEQVALTQAAATTKTSIVQNAAAQAVEAERATNEAAARSAAGNKALASSVGAHIQTIFSDLKAKDPGKALQDSAMKAIGEVLIKQGETAIASAGLYEMLDVAMGSLDGPLGLAAGLALVALGSAIESGASSSGSSGGGGGVGGGSSYSIGGTHASAFAGPGSAAASIAPAQRASTRAASIVPAAPIMNHNVFIGPNDPAVQRQMSELMARAARRGTTTG